MKFNIFLQNKNRQSLKNASKHAFSLAEVLITLTILGVIAALYIPHLYNQFQEKSFLTAYKKALSLMQNAVIEADAENADMSKWKTAKGIGDNNAYTFKYCDTNGNNCDFKAFLRDRFNVKRIDETTGDVTLIDGIVLLGAGNMPARATCMSSIPCVFAVDVNGSQAPNKYTTCTDADNCRVYDRFFILVGERSVAGLDSTKVEDFEVAATADNNMTKCYNDDSLNITDEHINAMKKAMKLGGCNGTSETVQ